MDVSWFAMLFLVLLGWYWVICLWVGYRRLGKLLDDVERRRVLAEKARK